MKTTGNLGLKKPEGTDLVDIADLNGNMDILDNAVTGKVDKVTGKQLSTNDYTAAEKTKLAGIATGANNYTHPNHTGDVTSTSDGVTAIAAGVIVDSDVNAAAAIAWSKINKAGSSLADLGTKSAGDLSTGTLSAARLPAISGDITMAAGTSTAAITTGVIVNADVNANAGIAFSKINSANSIMDSDISSEAYIDMLKIGSGRVNNALLDQLYGVTSPIQDQLNARPKQTTADITYYVRTDGNDSNTGLANTAGGSFKTINKAISMIPQIVNHVVSINIAAGTYSNEEIKIAGRSGGGEIKLIGALTLTNTHVAYGISLVRNTCRIGVSGLVFSRPTPNSIFNCFETVIQNCTVTSAVNDCGFFVDSSKVYFLTCSVSNRNPAFQAHTNSEVLIQGCSGSGNGYAVTAAYGGRAVLDSVTITSTNKYSIYAGGMVMDNNAGVLNPWGDNTTTQRSAVSAGSASNQSIIGSTYVKVNLGVVGSDNLGEYNPSLSRFTARSAGEYLVSATVGIAALPDAARVILALYKNGVQNYRMFDYATGQTNDATVTGAGSVNLSAGDYIEVYVYVGGYNVTLTGFVSLRLVRIA